LLSLPKSGGAPTTLATFPSEGHWGAWLPAYGVDAADFYLATSQSTSGFPESSITALGRADGNLTKLDAGSGPSWLFAGFGSQQVFSAYYPPQRENGAPVPFQLHQTSRAHPLASRLLAEGSRRFGGLAVVGRTVYWADAIGIHRDDALE
jgi:hypothetical protein